ncbi:MAG: hydrolase TatD [Candidatus Omnitrophica bacterium CG_4_9_14_0_2_um_filter_42_8]|nr:MAG: hydrolase TatD [Candidatus Omnitrophica bacterium CG22_combo_CG10-13_8_21_14_all_43_16]PJC48618.1 MAG: hydrolase TatD [Candidatus Omnitrophica bacterium CG_4_9_14_0_2_um_filter_42_8]
MLIDTHCHLDFKDFNDDLGAVLKRSVASGVKFIINVGSSLEGTARSVKIARENAFIYASIGIHPHEADKVSEGDFRIFEGFLKKPKVVAIGEIGLDYYRNISSMENQKRLFARLLEIAKGAKLPLVIHNRDSHEDMIDILKNIMGNSLSGVMHCFSGDEKFLKTCLDMGFFISFTCNITYKNAGKLREIVKLVPMDRLLLETDAPYLAPQDFRGARNEPMHVKYAAEEVAKIKGIDFNEVAAVTAENAIRLFNLPKC